jgi:cytochrome c nitrite reductase small subunit
MGLLRRLVRAIAPPLGWQIPVIVLGGAFVGLGLYTLTISRATSYLQDNPAACVNCHVMAPHYATWFHSSHRGQATCNDCHVPHDNIVNHYLNKASDGLRHAYVFTLRIEPAIIRLNERAERIVQDNCQRCHENENHRVATRLVTGADMHAGVGKTCWSCHREVPHGQVASQASVPHARVPTLPSPVPSWLRQRRGSAPPSTFDHPSEIPSSP